MLGPPAGCYGAVDKGMRRRFNLVATHQPTEFFTNVGKMLTVSQVADLLGAHANSVRRWADMGLFPSYRIGLRGDRRFRSDEISTFLVSRRNG